MKTMHAAKKCPFGPSFFSPKRNRPRKLEEEGEHSLHRERLADHTAGKRGEARPVGAELEFHRDAGNDTNCEIDGENLCPEAGRSVVTLIVLPQGDPLEHNDEQAKSHRELREEVVKRDGECKLQTVK